MSGYLIAIDGLPGTGKTTLCKALAEELKARYTKEPYTGGAFKEHRDLLHNPRHSQRTRALLMMGARSSHLEDIDFTTNDIFIFDRYILTTVGHQALSIGDAHVLYRCQTLPGMFRLPDLQIYLTASADVRADRMQGRGDNDELDEMNSLSQESHFHHGMRLMIEDRVPVTIMDTSNSTMEQCFNRLLSDIKEIVYGT